MIKLEELKEGKSYWYWRPCWGASVLAKVIKVVDCELALDFNAGFSITLSTLPTDGIISYLIFDLESVKGQEIESVSE